MISTTDFFYVSLGVGFLVLTGCGVAISIQLYKVLTNIRSVSDEIVGAVEEIVSAKENVKTVVTAVVSKLIDRISERKGGKTKKDNDG